MFESVNVKLIPARRKQLGAGCDGADIINVRASSYKGKIPNAADRGRAIAQAADTFVSTAGGRQSAARHF
jgi:hypothetical protein